MHRRVSRREPDGALIFRKVVQPQRPCVLDQDAEDAAPVRRVADLRLHLWADAVGDEAFEPAAGAIDDAERRILRAGHAGGGLDDSLEHPVERELRIDRDAGLDERPEAVDLARRSHLLNADTTGRSIPVTLFAGVKSFSADEARSVGEEIGIDWNSAPFDTEQFRMGMDVELEHGVHDPVTNVTHDDPIVTGKIALAHLNEFPDYYTRLERMEEDAKREHGG